MKVPVRSNYHTREAYQEKFEEREAWHKLVVKVIIWKDGLSETETRKLINKISLKEWRVYCQHMVKTNVTYGREKVLANLKETWQIIKKHGGFE